MSNKKPKPYPSDLLLDQCIQRDDRAIEKLYRLCFGYLKHVCFKFYPEKTTSESMVNLGFMRILKSLEQYERGRSFSNWIHQIMIRILIDEQRKEKRWNERVDAMEESMLDVKSSSNEGNQGEQNLMCGDVLDLLKKLSEKERLIFSLYALEEWTHNEIAERLDIKLSLSKWYVHQARKKLKNEIEKRAQNENSVKWTN